MAARMKKLGAAVARELEVAAAVAREEILETHTSQLLELIELSSGRVTPHRISEIYVRLHQLDETDAHAVRNRALAVLGVRARRALHEQEAPPRENASDAPRGPFRYLRERIRGRVHTELRRWIELHTGRVQIKLLEAHVRNATRFVAILSDEMPIQDAVQLYREMVGARDSTGTVVYWMVLARLSETGLPPVPVPADAPRLSVNGTAALARRNGRRATPRTPYRTV